MPSYYRTRSGKQWAVRWRVKHPLPGQPAQPYKTDTTWTKRSDAKAWYERHIAGRNRGASSTMPLSAYLDLWLSGTARKESTQETYSYAARCISKHLGHHKLRDIERLHVRAWHSALEQAGYALATRATYHVVLVMALGQAVDDGLLYTNPAAGITPSGQSPPPRPHWSPEESAQFLAQTTGDWAALAYRVMLLTGIRPGECRRLRWSDLALERATLSVPDSKTKAGVRTIALPAVLRDELRAWWPVQARRRMEAPSWADPALVVTSTLRPGAMQSKGYIRHRLRRYCEELDLPVITPQGLRHSYASWCAALGIHPLVVQQALGHRSIQTTLETYSHVSEGMSRQAAAALDGALSQPRAQRERG